MSRGISICSRSSAGCGGFYGLSSLLPPGSGFSALWQDSDTQSRSSAAGGASALVLIPALPDPQETHTIGRSHLRGLHP